VTEGFPKIEIHGLTSQLRRAVSVASNIAEGQGRLTRGEFCHFLGQAGGSLLELETQPAIAVDLRFLAQAEFKELEERILRSPKMTERPKRIDPSA
jgi:four helix bundle protein